MKKISIVVSCLMLAACSAKAPEHQKISPSLHHTLAMFFDPQKTAMNASDIYYVVKDSVRTDTIKNGNTIKLKENRYIDTICFVPQFYPVIDSLKKLVLDSTGKQVLTKQYSEMPDSLVWILRPEVRLNIDTVILRNFNSQYKINN